MKKKQGRRPVPDLLIEQWLLGELPEKQARLLAGDPQARARLEELQVSNREILEAYPPLRIAAGIRRAAEAQEAQEAQEAARRAAEREGARSAAGPAPRRAFRALPRLAPAIGFAALLVAAGLTLARVAPWLPAPAAGGPEAATEATRVKGGRPHLVIYRRTTAGVETLAAGAGVRPGDTLQIGYVAASRPYGVIFSIDGRGALTVHYPAGADAAGGKPAGGTGAPNRLEGEGEARLDYAYRLDDAPEFERFFLVTSRREFAVEAVLRAARELAARPREARQGGLALPRGLEQWSILLVKEGGGR